MQFRMLSQMCWSSFCRSLRYGMVFATCDYGKLTFSDLEASPACSPQVCHLRSIWTRRSVCPCFSIDESYGWRSWHYHSYVYHSFGHLLSGAHRYALFYYIHSIWFNHAFYSPIWPGRRLWMWIPVTSRCSHFLSLLTPSRRYHYPNVLFLFARGRAWSLCCLLSMASSDLKRSVAFSKASLALRRSARGAGTAVMDLKVVTDPMLDLDAYKLTAKMAHNHLRWTSHFQCMRQRQLDISLATRN